MLVYNKTEETFYDTETGLTTKGVETTEFTIEDHTIDRLCDTATKLMWLVAITVLGLVLKEYPPAQLIS